MADITTYQLLPHLGIVTSKLCLGVVLSGICACTAVDNKQVAVPEPANRQEMEVIATLLKVYQAENKASAKYFNQKIDDLPTWSLMIPLDVLPSTTGKRERPAYDRFLVALNELESYTADGRQPFAHQEDAYLLKQVHKTDKLLDTTLFKPETWLTPHQYKLPQIKRKVRYKYCRFSQPLFSLDNKAAYIQVDNAGSRVSYLMSKKAGKWVVVKAMLMWVA
jgi:hypothetical protein